MQTDAIKNNMVWGEGGCLSPYLQTRLQHLQVWNFLFKDWPSLFAWVQCKIAQKHAQKLQLVGIYGAKKCYYICKNLGY